MKKKIDRYNAFSEAFKDCYNLTDEDYRKVMKSLTDGISGDTVFIPAHKINKDQTEVKR